MTIEERLDRIERHLFAPAKPELIDHGNAIGSVIHQRRTAFGCTMAEVKKRGGPCIAFQSDVERGKRTNIGVPILIRWCAAIGCEPIMVFADIVSAFRLAESGNSP